MADVDPLNDRVKAKTRGRRGSARDSLFLSAKIRRVGGGLDLGLIPVRVRNLSSVGLMADHDGLTRPGDRVVVELRGFGLVPGEVAWVRRGRIGVSFDAAIDPKLARRPVNPDAPTTPKSFSPAS